MCVCVFVCLCVCVCVGMPRMHIPLPPIAAQTKRVGQLLVDDNPRCWVRILQGVHIYIYIHFFICIYPVNTLCQQEPLFGHFDGQRCCCCCCCCCCCFCCCCWEASMHTGDSMYPTRGKTTIATTTIVLPSNESGNSFF